MGLDIVHVLSPDRHYCEFECATCKRLTSLKSFVSSTCFHCICKSCCNPEKPTQCPMCRKPVGVLTSLEQSQPLAYRVLCRVKVACPFRKKHNCAWSGDYKNLLGHVDSHRRPNRATNIPALTNEEWQPTQPLMLTDASTIDHGTKRIELEPSVAAFTKRNKQNQAITPVALDDSALGLRRNQNIIYRQVEKTRIAEPLRITNAEHPPGTLPQATLQQGHGGSMVVRRRWSLHGVSNDLQRSLSRERRRNSADGSTPSRIKKALLQSPNDVLPPGGDEGTPPVASSHGQTTLTRSRGPEPSRVSSENDSGDGAGMVVPLGRHLSKLGRRLNTGSDSDGQGAPLVTHNDVAVAQKCKENGVRAFHAGNYQAAIEVFTEGIQALRNPNKDQILASSILANRAASHLRLCQYGKCINDCDDALRLQANNVKAYLRKSWAYIELGDFDAACNTLSTRQGRIPKSPELEREFKFTNHLATTMNDVHRFFNEEKYQEVLQATDTLEGHGSNKHVLLARGKAFLMLNLPDEAIETANVVFVSDNQNTDALEIRAKCRYLNGRLDDALMDCQTALGINPTHESLENTYQKIRLVNQLFAEAESSMVNKAYKQAANMYGKTIHASEPLPKSTELYRMLHLARAEAHYHATNYMQALANANLVLESLPTLTRAWEAKVKALEAMNRYAQLYDELTDVVRPESWGYHNRYLRETYDRCNAILNGPVDEQIRKPLTTKNYPG